MTALVTLSLLALIAMNAAMTRAVIGKLRIAQREVEADGGLPDPDLAPRGMRIGAFRVPVVAGPPGELSDGALGAGTTLVGFFTPGCLPCEAVCEQLEDTSHGVPIIALVHAAANGRTAADDRLFRRLSNIAQVGYLDDRVKAAFAFRDQSGFPTLFKIRKGRVVAAGHRMAELS
jgi:thiol-disulfide isomerase/thioredoxin